MGNLVPLIIWAGRGNDVIEENSYVQIYMLFYVLMNFGLYYLTKWEPHEKHYQKPWTAFRTESSMLYSWNFAIKFSQVDTLCLITLITIIGLVFA